MNDRGYGIYNRTRAHRIAYEMVKGPIPSIDGKPAKILHSCDNPMCVNPDHLRAGTQQENIADMVLRRRNRRGEKHHWNRHSASTIGSVCEAIVAGMSSSDIRSRFGVSAGLIASIRHGNAYCQQLRSAGGSPINGRADRRVSDDRAREIYAAAWAGEKQSEIATRYGVKPSFVADIKRGATYATATGHRR